MIRPFLFLILPIVVAGCYDAVIHEQHYTLDAEEGWEYENVLEFPFTITDTSQRFGLLLDLEHSPDYQYQNLYLRLTTIFPDADTARSPLSLELADKAGQWYGDCSSWRCVVTIPLQEHIYFNQPGDYAILIEQFMRINPVKGVYGLNMRLEEELGSVE